MQMSQTLTMVETVVSPRRPRLPQDGLVSLPAYGLFSKVVQVPTGNAGTGKDTPRAFWPLGQKRGSASFPR